MHAASVNFRAVRKNIWLCYAFDVLLSLHFTSAVLVPFFTQWAHLSFTQMHLIQSWFLLWVFILEVPTGVIADRFGKKTSLGLGAIISAIGLLIYSLYPGFLPFLLAEFLIALSITLISGAYDALLYDQIDAGELSNESKKIFGRSHSFQMAGILIAAPIGGYIAAHTELNIPMLMEAAAALLAFVVLLNITEPKRDGHDVEVEHYLTIAKKGLSFLRSHATTRTIAFQMAIVGVAGYFVIWLYQPLLSSIGIPIEYFGWFNVMLVGTQIIISSNFGRIEKFFPSLQNYITFTVLLILIGFALSTYIPSLATALLFVTITGGFALTHGKYMSAHINQWIPKEQRATVLSFVNMLQKIFIVVINPLVGMSIDYSLKLGLLIVLAFVLLSFVSLLSLRLIRGESYNL